MVLLHLNDRHKEKVELLNSFDDASKINHLIEYLRKTLEIFL